VNLGELSMFIVTNFSWNVGFTNMGIRKLKFLLFIIVHGELNIEGT
jgi:hypothetical protein